MLWRLTAVQNRIARRAAIAGTCLVAPLVLSSCFGSIGGLGSDKTASGASAHVTLDQQLLAAGITQFNEKQYTKAIEDFEAAYGLKGALNSTKYLAQFDLGVLYVETGKVSLAESAFETSLSVNPNYSYSLNDLALIEAPSNPTFAISLYQRLLQQNPANKSSVYTALGNLYTRVGNEKKALEYLSLAGASPPSATPTT